MKESVIRNILWGLLIIIILLIASHYDYKCQQEDRLSFDTCKLTDTED